MSTWLEYSDGSVEIFWPIRQDVGILGYPWLYSTLPK